jgi:hypothetical protein
MKDDRPPLDPPDDEELRSAAALARALEGGSAEPDVPQAALEAAALLRLSAGAGRLAEERRAQIRRELIEELARAPKASREPRLRFTWPRWLLLAFPLAGAAALSLLVFVRNPEPTAQHHRTTLAGDDAVSPSRAGVEGAARPTAGAAANAVLEREEAAASDDSISTADSIASEQRGAPRAERAPEPLASPAPAAHVGRAAPSQPGEGVRTRYETSAETPAPAAKQSPSEADVGALRAQRAPAADQVPGTDGLAAARPSEKNSRRAAEPGAGHSEHDRGLRGAGPRPADESTARRVDDGARRALAAIDREVGARRAALLARVDDTRLRRTHAEADAASGRAELERSQRNLSQTLATLGDGLDPTDARLVRQDLYCRLAETALRLGEPRAALEWTRRGLDLDGPPSAFLAQLRALEGDAWAALGEGGNAAASYMKALRVHEALLDESLDGR